MLLLATCKDLLEIDNLAILVINDMRDSNIPQWKKGYPSYADFKQDIDDNILYIYKEDNKILGTITFLKENDPAYKTINSWLKEKSIVIHRMMVHPQAHGKGIATRLLNKAISYGIENKYESIKIDTHLENYKMRNFLKKNGFIEIEYLEVIDRLACEKVLED
ncbi:MAG: GNAT family N-acetyltransferase [Candidatus Izimaplasma sp.]|nr:GNAT family N-acetyltransferase [Candidatus Izimaplasma bacterium]